MNFIDARGQRCVCPDLGGVVGDESLEFLFRHQPVDQPNAERFVGIDVAGGKHQILRRGGADDTDQPLNRMKRIAERQLGGRHAEFRFGGAEPQIAHRRQIEPAADAVAVDHGDGRFGKLQNAVIDDFDALVVMGDGLGRSAFLVELGNIGARHEGFAARAAEDKDPDILVGLEIGEDRFDRIPHVQRYRVMAFRVVENHMADDAITAAKHLVG